MRPVEIGINHVAVEEEHALRRLGHYAAAVGVVLHDVDHFERRLQVRGEEAVLVELAGSADDLLAVA